MMAGGPGPAGPMGPMGPMAMGSTGPGPNGEIMGLELMGLE